MKTATILTQSGHKKTSTPSTQSFTEIEDIREHYVILKGGSGCTVVEVQSTNFALLSEEEQRVKLLSYASLLNSLSFPIQILIRSKRVDITSYIKSLETQAHQINFPTIQAPQREKLSSFILKYKGFVEELTKVNTVLDKKFYIVIPYTSLEQGAKGVLKNADFFDLVKASLRVKADSLIKEIHHLSLRAKLLEQNELMALFYEFFNAQPLSKDSEQKTQKGTP